MTKQFKKWDNLKVRISVNNIFDSHNKSIYESFDDVEYIFSDYKKGRTFSFGVSYQIK